MNVAVDAMGGDNAPEVVVQGALKAAAEAGVDITLVGDQKRLEKLLESYSSSSMDHVSVHHCDQVVLMNESPLRAIREKKSASIRVAFDLVKTGRAEAVVSAGHSGAALAAGVIGLGRMKGITRPALAGLFPGEQGDVLLIDVGANVDCRPAHLFQFGVMAHAFARTCMGVREPKIGLLSIGTEGGKGNEQVRQTRELFEESHLAFAGNVEGREIFTGALEVIVCDGFVGNVALKLSEGMAESVTGLLKKELWGTWPGRAALLLGRGTLDKFLGRLDYEEYGGVPLLGIKGIGIICHGGSSPKAIKNGIKLAVKYVRNDFLEKMGLELEEQGIAAD